MNIIVLTWYMKNSKKNIDYINSLLVSYGFSSKKIITEFSIYDSNLTLDNNWINS
jgi:hypothetical protein